MNAKNVALWVVTVLVAALMIFASLGKLSSNPEMVQNFAGWGYGVGFLHFIGLCELLGGIGLLVPRTRFWAAVGLILIMAGAVWTHLSHGQADGKHLPAPVIALVLLIVIAAARRGEAGRIFAKGNLLTGV